MDFPDPKVPGHDERRRVEPWVVAGFLLVGALLFGCVVCNLGAGVLLM